MASNYWIKLYHEILHDPKMGRLPDNLWRRVIECFLMAGEQDEGGFLPDLGGMAWGLRLDDETLAAELEQLSKIGVLKLVDGRWFVARFSDRQKAMSSAERTQRHRERQRGHLVTDGETDISPNGDAVEAIGNGSCNDYETNRYTDTDKDKETEKEQKREDKKPYISSPPAYVPPESEPIAAMKTAIAAISKETLWVKTEPVFTEAAYELIGRDAEPEQVAAFGLWWKANGWHNGKPALTNILDHWNDFQDGICLRPAKNGKAPKVCRDCGENIEGTGIGGQCFDCAGVTVKR